MEGFFWTFAGEGWLTAHSKNVVAQAGPVSFVPSSIRPNSL